MNEDTIKGQWKQLRGEVRKQWGKLTDDDIDQIAGERDKLVGKVQERYGQTREEAHEAVDRFYRRDERPGASPDLGRDLGRDVRL
jgi:uncharacterized protein YjbJ (UPF0337 family)